MIWRSALLDLEAAGAGVHHGFGTRAEPFPPELAALWKQKQPQWVQTHGAASAEVTQAAQSCGEVDALFTRVAAQPIAVVTADCVPLLLARRDGGAVAAIHAGWRGTRAEIARQLAARLTASGERMKDWVAAVGPAIGPCCYEVSPEIAQEFSRAFGQAAVPKPRYLDLPAINRAQLLAAGVSEVELLRACTRCALGAEGQPIFHSYRREGGGTRQYSVIATMTERRNARG